MALYPPKLRKTAEPFGSQPYKVLEASTKSATGRSKIKELSEPVQQAQVRKGITIRNAIKAASIDEFIDVIFNTFRDQGEVAVDWKPKSGLRHILTKLVQAHTQHMTADHALAGTQSARSAGVIKLQNKIADMKLKQSAWLSSVRTYNAKLQNKVSEATDRSKRSEVVCQKAESEVAELQAALFYMEKLLLNARESEKRAFSRSGNQNVAKSIVNRLSHEANTVLILTSFRAWRSYLWTIQQDRMLAHRLATPDDDNPCTAEVKANRILLATPDDDPCTAEVKANRILLATPDDDNPCPAEVKAIAKPMLDTELRAVYDGKIEELTNQYDAHIGNVVDGFERFRRSLEIRGVMHSCVVAWHTISIRNSTGKYVRGLQGQQDKDFSVLVARQVHARTTAATEKATYKVRHVSEKCLVKVFTLWCQALNICRLLANLNFMKTCCLFVGAFQKKQRITEQLRAMISTRGDIYILSRCFNDWKEWYETKLRHKVRMHHETELKTHICTTHDLVLSKTRNLQENFNTEMGQIFLSGIMHRWRGIFILGNCARHHAKLSQEHRESCAEVNRKQRGKHCEHQTCVLRRWVGKMCSLQRAKLFESWRGIASRAVHKRTIKDLHYAQLEAEYAKDEVSKRKSSLEYFENFLEVVDQNTGLSLVKFVTVAYHYHAWRSSCVVRLSQYQRGLDRKSAAVRGHVREKMCGFVRVEFFRNLMLTHAFALWRASHAEFYTAKALKRVRAESKELADDQIHSFATSHAQRMHHNLDLLTNRYWVLEVNAAFIHWCYVGQNRRRDQFADHVEREHRDRVRQVEVHCGHLQTYVLNVFLTKRKQVILLKIWTMLKSLFVIQKHEYYVTTRAEAIRNRSNDMLMNIRNISSQSKEYAVRTTQERMNRYHQHAVKNFLFGIWCATCDVANARNESCVTMDRLERDKNMYRSGFLRLQSSIFSLRSRARSLVVLSCHFRYWTHFKFGQDCHKWASRLEAAQTEQNFESLQKSELLKTNFSQFFSGWTSSRTHWQVFTAWVRTWETSCWVRRLADCQRRRDDQCQSSSQGTREFLVKCWKEINLAFGQLDSLSYVLRSFLGWRCTSELSNKSKQSRRTVTGYEQLIWDYEERLKAESKARQDLLELWGPYPSTVRQQRLEALRAAGGNDVVSTPKVTGALRDWRQDEVEPVTGTATLAITESRDYDSVESPANKQVAADLRSETVRSMSVSKVKDVIMDVPTRPRFSTSAINRGGATASGSVEHDPRVEKRATVPTSTDPGRSAADVVADASMAQQGNTAHLPVVPECSVGTTARAGPRQGADEVDAGFSGSGRSVADVIADASMQML